MKKSKIITILLAAVSAVVMAACCAAGTASDSAKSASENNAPSAPKQRKIAVQMYTFRSYTFEESVPWLTKNGIYGLGITAGQELTKKYPKLRFGPKMNAEQRKWFKDFVKANKCWIASFGVTYGMTEEGVEEICAFAKEMGIPLILTEDKPHLMPAWEKYCKKYGVKMAVHNHASNSSNNYYNPEVVKNLVAPYANIGACPDNGHWSRSGIDSVYGYKVLQGKIFAVHFKDQAEFGNIKNQCVPYGTGALDMKAMLAELDRQGFDGPFIIEYEAKWDDNLADVVKCAEYLRQH